MKKWVNGLMVFGVLFGSLSVTTAFGPATSIHAAAPSAAQEKLKADIADALNQRLGSYQTTYTGNMKTLKADINNALNAAMSSDDYLHYIMKKYGFSATSKGDTATITFNFTYWETMSQTNEVKSRITEVLGQILTPDMNDHQKEKAIHDWIVSNIAYDKKLVSHSAYDGLFNGKTVCQGYALITYEMLQQAGIPVKIVEGSSRGIAHAWNLVQIDGQWYHLDSTWDDPVPNVDGQVLYNYYNVTDAELRADHTWKASNLYPKSAVSYNKALTSLAGTDSARAEFYQTLSDQLGYSYLAADQTVANVAGLIDKIRTSIDNNQQELVIRYMKGASVAADLKKALAAQKGITGFSYTQEPYTRTVENDKLLHITFKYAGETAKN